MSWHLAASAAVPVVLVLAVGGCGGGGGSDPEVGARELYVVDVDAGGSDGWSLNSPIRIEFSEYVLPESIRHDTVRVRLGPRFGIEAFGDYKVSGNEVTFYPRIPTRADLGDSGFQPQALYQVTVVGHPNVDHVAAYTGRPLIRTFVAEFQTAATSSPDLFTIATYRDPPPPKVIFTNPPDRLPKSPWSAAGGAVDVPTDSEIQVVFNRVPLSPATITKGNVTLTMVERLGVPMSRQVLGIPVLEQSFEGTTLRFVPDFPLAKQARYVLQISDRVTDLTGGFDVAPNEARAGLRSMAESGVDPALSAFALAHPEEVDPRTFLIFTTRDEPGKDRVDILNFDGTDRDQFGTDGHDSSLSTADFNGVVPGSIAATFLAAGGNGSLGDFTPTSSTTLSTNSPNTPNGIFQFRRIDVPANVTVTLSGTLPASLLALKSAIVRGEIGLSGGKGGDGAANFTSTVLAAASGGVAGPAGGKGGDNYRGSQFSNFTSPPGADAPSSGGRGGAGGGVPTTNGTHFTSGGGGGGGGHQFAGSRGVSGAYPTYSSWNGLGGAGGAAGGIQPLSTATRDGRDYWRSGAGGGGGGAGAPAFESPVSTGWRLSGAGGGGGGGGLLIQAAGDIRLSGRIHGRGGAGGNGGASTWGGAGGGGGAGGSIVVYANGQLDVAGSSLDTSGGAGGSGSSSNWSGAGGKGGGGYIQLEDSDGAIAGTGSASLVPDYYSGRFDPVGLTTDSPSVFVGKWFYSGVFDPELQAPARQDFLDQEFPGCSIRYEIQMAVENPTNPGFADASSINPATQGSSDTAKASQFETIKDPVLGIRDVSAAVNGRHYQYFRVRITFTLKDGQRRVDPLPYVDSLRLRFRY